MSRVTAEHDLMLGVAKSALMAESEAIGAAAERLDGEILAAAELILRHTGKVVVSGVGKSGHVAQKIVATLCSTGTPAVFMHATDALHGDLGIYAPGDPTILISKSGSTVELLRLVPLVQQLNSAVIAIVGNTRSSLAQLANVALDASVAREADSLNLIPTCSSTVALALGDALAAVLMHGRSFSENDFAKYHPAGQLGYCLAERIKDVMHRGDAVAWIDPEAPIRELIIVMTDRPLGAACVVDADHHLLGLVTDGDLRRALLSHEDIRQLRVMDLMTRRPLSVGPDASLREALRLMEERRSQLSVLPVVDELGRCVGMVRIHDVCQPNLASKGY